MAKLKKNVAPNVMKSVNKRKRIGPDCDVEGADVDLGFKCDVDISGTIVFFDNM